ncbi:MAG TPA: VacJ family lipoprotein [Steroidobacteraceae bacterium]
MSTCKMPASSRPLRAFVTLLAMVLGVAGCVALPKGEKPDPRDRFERLNRGIYIFNVKVDHAVLRPAARTYVRITPRPVRTGVSNFMSNLTYTTTILNDFLQGHWRFGVSDTTRLVVNTIFGLGGIFDVATPSGLDRHSADFGQTLGKWGVHSGPYVMLPFLGPSTVRDSFGLLADEYTTPRAYITDPYIRWSLFSVDLLDHRASLLPEDKFIDQSFDPYAFIRNVWLQRRDYEVHGDRAPEVPPDEPPEDQLPPESGAGSSGPPPQ